MKQLKLILLLCICCQGLYAQNPLDLRGVRYYYSTPTIGNLSSLANNIYRGYRPYDIFEKGDHYIIGGGQHEGYFRAGVVCIDKWNDTIAWDFRTQFNGFSRIQSMIDLPGEQFIAAFNHDTSTLYQIDDYATNTVVFNLDGSSTEQMLPVGRFEERTQFTKVSPTLNAYNNESNNGTLDPSIPVVDLIDNNGNYLYTKNLPYTPTFNNLPVIRGLAKASYKYYDAIVTFGDQIRMRTDLVANMPNGYVPSPALWVWGSDDIFYSKELYANYPDYSSDMTNFYHWDNIIKVAANQNEFVIATNAVAEQTPGSTNYVFKNFLTCLDTNLQIKNFREVRSNNSLKMCWFVTDLKWDTVHNQILVTGVMHKYSNIYHDTLVSKTNFIARCYANGIPIFYKYFYYDTELETTDLIRLAVCENGDLLFTGEGYNPNGVHFFTYRTDPDGYHPDGQYVGIQEVLVSPTEIGIFPNPSDGIFEISSMSDEIISVNVFNEQGSLIMSSELPNPSENSVFDLSNQVPGVYFAHISQGEQQWVKKLVVR
jgi:hypothetical protein